MASAMTALGQKQTLQATLLSLLEAENAASLLGCSNAAPMLSDGVHCQPHKFSVALREAVLRDPDVIFKASANCIRTPGQGPAHHLRLMPSDSCRCPGAAWKNAFCFRQKNVEKVLVRWHRVLDAHDELHMRSFVH